MGHGVIHSPCPMPHAQYVYLPRPDSRPSTLHSVRQSDLDIVACGAHINRAISAEREHLTRAGVPNHRHPGIGGIPGHAYSTGPRSLGDRGRATAGAALLDLAPKCREPDPVQINAPQLRRRHHKGERFIVRVLRVRDALAVETEREQRFAVGAECLHTMWAAPGWQRCRCVDLNGWFKHETSLLDAAPDEQSPLRYTTGLHGRANRRVICRPEVEDRAIRVIADP